MKFKKNWWEWLWPNRIALLALTACGPDTFTRAPTEAGADTAALDVMTVDAADDTNTAADAIDARADADADAATPLPDAAPDGDAGCATIWGATACDGIMAAYCQALYNCNGGMTVMQCKAWWAANYPSDFDCAANKFKKQACAADPNKCSNVEIPSYMCGKLMSSTPSQLGGACASFFAGFP
jgi:hypothetical protein